MCFVMGVRRLVILLRCVKCRHYSQIKRHIFTVWLAVIKNGKGIVLFLCCWRSVLLCSTFQRWGEEESLCRLTLAKWACMSLRPGERLVGCCVLHRATPKILRKQKYIMLANFLVMNTKMTLKLRIDSGFQIKYGISYERLTGRHWGGVRPHTQSQSQYHLID